MPLIIIGLLCPYTQSPTYKTPHAVQEPQPIKRLPISPPSIVILRVLTSSSELPLKLPGHAWNQMAVELVQEIGRRITLVTEDSRETVFLFQRLSIALQRGNAVSFLARSLPPINHPLQSFLA